MNAQELLENLQKVVMTYDWSKEVRFNWLREFGKSLVFFQHPQYALEFDRLVQEESVSPRGMIAINRLLSGKCCDEIKIAGIKKILNDRGYNGEKEEKSWIRTDNTHNVYAQLAKMILNYEKGEECVIPIRL